MSSLDHTRRKISRGSRVWWLGSECNRRQRSKGAQHVGYRKDHPRRLPGLRAGPDEDFEGHKLESLKIEEKLESDFEGHRMMDSKIEPKFEERVEQ